MIITAGTVLLPKYHEAYNVNIVIKFFETPSTRLFKHLFQLLCRLCRITDQILSICSKKGKTCERGLLSLSETKQWRISKQKAFLSEKRCIRQDYRQSATGAILCPIPIVLVPQITIYIIGRVMAAHSHNRLDRQFWLLYSLNFFNRQQHHLSLFPGCISNLIMGKWVTEEENIPIIGKRIK